MTTITLAPVNVLHVVYASIAIFSIALILNKNQYKALIILLLAHATQDVFNIVEELKVFVSFPLVTPAIQLAVGPLYYLFAKNLIHGNFVVKKHFVHLLPACIGIAFTTWWPEVLQVAFVIFLIYIFLTFRLLQHYRQTLVEVTADSDRYALNWLTRTLGIIGVIECIDFVRLNSQLQMSQDVFIYSYFFSELIHLFITCYLIIKAVNHPRLFADISEFEGIVNTPPHLEQKQIDNEQAKTIFINIEQHLERTSAYRQAKYSLRQLAKEIGLSEQMVSWSINQGGELSFSDYINSLRINEVKRTFANSSAQQNILDVAFSAGFSSKSTFNAVFKRNLGVTPSQYLKNSGYASLKQ